MISPYLCLSFSCSLYLLAYMILVRNTHTRLSYHFENAQLHDSWKRNEDFTVEGDSSLVPRLLSLHPIICLKRVLHSSNVKMHLSMHTLSLTLVPLLKDLLTRKKIVLKSNDWMEGCIGDYSRHQFVIMRILYTTTTS